MLERPLSVVLAAGSLLATAAAQDLQLDVRGGSLPGLIETDAYPSLFPFEPILVQPSATAGPTPCSVFDPNDPRSLSIGLDLLGSGWAGNADLNGHYAFSFPIAGSPSLQDLPLFMQAFTFSFQVTIIDRMSNPNVIRLGNSGTFRHRGVYAQFDRAFATVFPRNDRKWLLVGGARGQLLAQQAWASTEIYDPITDGFSPGPSMNTPRSMHSATQLADGRWLVAGGVNATNDPQDTVEIYDPALDTFTLIAPMGTPRMGHTATLLANGKVLVTGGIQAMPTTPTQLEPIHQTVNTTELYDPLTGVWTAGPNLLTPRAGHAAITRPDGKVLLAGGISWDNNIVFGWVPAVRRSCDLYNPATNTLASAPQMANARSMIDPVDLGNDRWLFAGGIAGITIIPWNPGNPTATAEIYDAAANTWTTVGPMATARGNQRGWRLENGNVVLAGGASGSILSPTPLASTEIFSPTTNTFTPGPAMVFARAGAAEFRTPQGQVQLFGGATTGTTISATCEWYYF
jgi:hypothetical protein